MFDEPDNLIPVKGAKLSLEVEGLYSHILVENVGEVKKVEIEHENLYSPPMNTFDNKPILPEGVLLSIKLFILPGETGAFTIKDLNIVNPDGTPKE